MLLLMLSTADAVSASSAPAGGTPAPAAAPHDEADVMRELAVEARSAGSDDVEARALVAASWLYLECGARTEARQGVRRLHELAKSTSLSPDTRNLLRASIR